MALYQYKNFIPQIEESVYIAPDAQVIGRVILEKDCNIWFNTVVRGDINEIRIGQGTNIQDLCMLHVIEEIPLIIGKGVSVGHNAILHACTVEDNCLIGMGAIVLDGAVIGKNSVVAAGSVVPPGKKFPPNSLIMGSPASVKRALTEEERKGYGEHFKTYIETKNEYLNSKILKKIKD